MSSFVSGAASHGISPKPIPNAAARIKMNALIFGMPVLIYILPLIVSSSAVTTGRLTASSESFAKISICEAIA